MNTLNNVPSQGTFGQSIAKINENFSLLQEAIGELESLDLGFFLTSSELQTAYPNPAVGMSATVGNQFEIYRCETEGTWTATGEKTRFNSEAVTSLPETPDEHTIYAVQGESSWTEQVYSNGAWVVLATHSGAIPEITVDATPTENSTNPVQSGGVWTEINDLSVTLNGKDEQNYIEGYKVVQSGAFEADATSVVCDKVSVSYGQRITFYKAYSYICAYDANDNKLDHWSARSAITLNTSLVTNVSYIRCSILKTNLSIAYIKLDDTTLLWQAQSTHIDGIQQIVGNMEDSVDRMNKNIYDYSATGKAANAVTIPLDIQSGHSYRLVPITRTWDITGIADTSAIFWGTIDSTDIWTIRVNDFLDNGLEEYYDFSIDSETSASISVRAATGVTVKFRLYDNTETLPEGNYERILGINGRLDELETMGDILRLHPHAITAPILANLNEIKSVDTHNPFGTIKNFVTMFFSDMHSTSGALERMMKFYNAYSEYFTQVIQGGDLLHTFDDMSLVADDITNYGAEGIIGVIGNHEKLTDETMYINGVQIVSPFRVSPKTLYDNLYAPHLSQTGIQIGENQTYWYKDFPDNKIRVVGIDCYHWNEQLKLANDTYVQVYSDGTPCDTGQQATWLTTTLAGAKTLEYSVIAVIHNPAYFGTGAIQSPFTCLDYVGDNIVGQNANNAVAEIVQDFIDDGGNFVCWLTGHIHQDAIGTLNNYPEQFQINIDTCRYGERFGTLVAWGENKKILNTMSEDCFEVISVDSNRQYLSIIRFGCEYDRWGRHLDSFVYDYGNHQVLYNPK